MFITLVLWGCVSRAYAYVQTHQIVYIKYVQLMVYQSYLKKTLKNFFPVSYLPL